MSSILNNSAALSALRALNMTQQSLNTVQNQVSSGLSVANASDNSSYWSIAQQLNSDSGMVTASQSALSEGQSILSTATSAINSVLTTLNAMATQLTEAQNPGAVTADINTSLASLGKQLADAVNGASFNNMNVLNGSQVAAMSFVSGFNASATGGSVNTINFTAQALTGGAASTPTTTTTTSTITDANTIADIAGLTATTGSGAPTFGQDVITASATGQPLSVTVASADLYGNITTTTYTALDANGNNSLTDTSLTMATASSLAVSTTTKTSGTTNLLTQNSIDLTGGSGATSTFQIGGTTTTGGTITASGALTAVNEALAAVQNYSAYIGATQSRMTAASTFNSDLTTNYSNGVAGLVDADMNTASTKLQALQTQEQLGIQSLSIANQNAQLILKLFG
jgi:flagellin